MTIISSSITTAHVSTLCSTNWQYCTATCNRLHTDTTNDQLKHYDMYYKLYFVNGSENFYPLGPIFQVKKSNEFTIFISYGLLL